MFKTPEKCPLCEAFLRLTPGVGYICPTTRSYPQREISEDEQGHLTHYRTNTGSQYNEQFEEWYVEDYYLINRFKEDSNFDHCNIYLVYKETGLINFSTKIEVHNYVSPTMPLDVIKQYLLFG